MGPPCDHVAFSYEPVNLINEYSSGLCICYYYTLIEVQYEREGVNRFIVALTILQSQSLEQGSSSSMIGTGLCCCCAYNLICGQSL